MTARYALYWTPEPDGPLARFGAGWLGRDPVPGRTAEPLAVPGIDDGRRAAITGAPRRYGLHATLKPPFALAAGVGEDDLLARLDEFAALAPAVAAPPLELADLKGFLALVLSAPTPHLHGLADTLVARFDDLRAPAAETELARRRAAGLSPRQDAHLLRWGYPYVFEDFTFHVTLTDRLDDVERAAVRDILAPLVAPFCGTAWRLDAISLLREDPPGSGFVLVRRVALRG